MELLASPAAAAPVHYFVVAEWPGLAQHGDSFLLPLTDPDDVDHARALIEQGPEAAGQPLVFAAIAAGADGINRDVMAHGRLWSWHVSGFEGFGDFGVELLDGWPTFVEGDVQGWIANTCGCLEPGQTELPPDADGHIGFWNYTVVSELGPETRVAEPAGGMVLLGGAALLLARLLNHVKRSRGSTR